MTQRPADRKSGAGRMLLRGLVNVMSDLAPAVVAGTARATSTASVTPRRVRPRPDRRARWSGVTLAG